MDSSSNAGGRYENTPLEGVGNTHETQESSVLHGRKRKTSKAWEYFEELPLEADGKGRAKCIKCNRVYLSGGTFGTSNLIKHYKSCFHLNDNSRSVLRTARFNPVIFRELIDQAIIRHDLPFRFVEYEGIRIALKYANPEIAEICRNTAKGDVVKIYYHEKDKMKKLLNSHPGRISLTSDLWSACNKDGYISLTAHFIDSNWKLQKKILNFRFMPTPHIGIAICQKFYSLLIEWGIEKKIFSMTLDNSTANFKFIGLLREQLNSKSALVSEGEFLHLRCCAHVLNLIVQEGLKEIDESVEKIRLSVKYVNDSQQRKEKFLECIEHVSLDAKKRSLGFDVPTRWNSTFFMLENALFYRKVFHHLHLSDSNYTNYPNDEEWSRVEKICNFLSVFYKVTNVFSGRKYPTANLYFPQIFLVKHQLDKALKGDDAFMYNMASRMQIKFEKY